MEPFHKKRRLPTLPLARSANAELKSGRWYCAGWDKLTDSQTAQDFLNAGHLEWCSGNIQLAISMYRHAKALSSPEQFADSFASDISTLKSKGIPATDISLMQDLLSKDSDN